MHFAQLERPLFLISIDQEIDFARLETTSNRCAERGDAVSETTAAPERQPPPEAGGASEREDGEPDDGNRLVESILDNLPAWAFVALAIAALYLVWATLVIVAKYVGGLPSFTP